MSLGDGLRAAGLQIEVAGRVLTRELSFSVAPGEGLAVAGPSGSGKTTLLRVLARLRDPDAGRVTFHGEDAETIGFPAYRRRVVYLAQRAAIFPGTVAENLARPFRLAVSREPFPEERARSLLAKLGLAGAFEAEAARLSEGERQRLGLARALSIDPEVFLLDEPTSALDATLRDRVEALLLERKEAGAILVLVSHDEAQIARLAGDVVRLEATDA